MNYPNLAYTPGVAGTTRVPRDVPGAVKSRVFAEYGIGRLRRLLYTIDHLVPLELCGTNDIRNLWPQPRLEALVKDREEAALASQVKSGALTLQEAQQRILTHWTKLP